MSSEARDRPAKLPRASSPEPCFAFQRGDCQRGAACRYSHAAPPDESVCFQFQRGACTRGDACKFSHRPRFCADLANGECLKGDQCAFSHQLASQPPKARPNFGLSGALSKDLRTGNVRQGHLVKWAEPKDAKLPTGQWRLYVFHGAEPEDALYLHRQSAFLFGRDKKVADVHLDSSSCSKEHAVLQFRQPDPSAPVKPYIIDLESINGTKLNGQPIVTSRYVELLDGDVLSFADDPREFVLMETTDRKKD